MQWHISETLRKATHQTSSSRKSNTCLLSKQKHMYLNIEKFDIMNKGSKGKPRAVATSDKEDELVSHERGYGKGFKPRGYLNEFKSFITNNMNKIAALQVVGTRPSNLTLENLKSLRLGTGSRRFYGTAAEHCLGAAV